MNKKKLIAIMAASVFALGVNAENVTMATPSTSLVVEATKGQPLKFVYYGARLASADQQFLGDAGASFYDVYPAYGMSAAVEDAIAVCHTDGNMTLKLLVEGTETRQENGASVQVFRLKDAFYPLRVNVCYRTYADSEVLETWTEITNGEKGTVVLRRFDSGYLPIRRGNVWLSHLSGSWANEAQVTEEPLTPGMMVIENKDGSRNAHTSHSEVMFSLDGKPQENAGRVIGAALCYAGNYKLRINTHDDEYHGFFAGINDENSEYKLAKGETFTTPVLALTYTDKGLSGASRNFHRWARAHRLANGNTPRKILLNSWEGVYFNINEEGMAQMMKDIKEMGGELFVMDDGWFGDKYPRNNDSSSLGDWTVDTRKLPNGIGGLINEADRQGIKFGIWLEPEMTNTVSELYEKHPDWVIKASNRDVVTGRGGTQLVLDMGNPKVQDFAFNLVDQLMTKYPQIDYIKWDANMPVSSHGSQYLSADKQSHLYIAYHQGLEKVMQRIRAKYPKLTIQECASGGGRANYGLLPYFDEFWTSDNTDALQRIYMQWGTSYFFPAIAMGSHISAVPNHTVFRTTPLKFRIDVAMSGRLGMEIQPKNMTDEEKDQCRRAIADYKTIRNTVQMGDIYRLQSPFEHKGVASLMYVNEAKSQAVFYWWKTENFYNQHLPRIPMAGLDPARTYRVKELNRIDNKPLAFEGKTFTGAFLMANGLEIPYTHDVDYNKKNDYSSRVLVLEAE